MKLQDIINLIMSKGYLFQISIPGSSFNQGKTTKEQALADSSSLNEYFDKVIKANSAKTLFIRLFSRNGSAWRNRGEHLLFLDQQKPVATNQINATEPIAEPQQNATVTKPIQTSPAMNGLDTPVKTPSAMMDAKDKIEFEVLKVKHEMLSGVKNSLEKENHDLRKKVDLLHEEKLQLVKDQSVSNEKNKLETEKAIFAMEKQGKEGLSGLIGELNENPETLKMLIGFLKPDHPMFKENDGDQMSGTKQIEAPKYHDIEEVNAILTDMPNTIKNLDPKVIARIYYIFLNAFAKDPENVNKVFKDFFPNAPQ